MDELLVTEGRALKHVQVREYVRTLVAGAAPGSPAPSERELVHRFGVARMTVRQAMDALVVEGLLAESQTLLARREQAGPGVARALNLTEGDAVIHWRRLRRADGQPMCLEDAYLNEVLIPGFLQSGMPTSLYDALEARGLRPTWAEDSITADVASEEEAEHLGLSLGEPVLRHSRRGLAGEKVVEVSRTVYRADRYTMWLQVGAEG